MSKRMKPAGSWSVKLMVAAAVVACGALLGWGFLKGRNEADQDRAIKVPIRVSNKNGDPVITLDAATQQRSGIETAALPSTHHPEELRAYGMVLDVARLTELSNNYANAKAPFGTDQASLAAAEAQVRTLTATAYQEWGSVLGKSLVDESPMITALIERQTFLLQITLPPGV